MMKNRKVLWILAFAGWILLAVGASLGLLLYYKLPLGVCFVVGANVGFAGVLAGLISLSVWKGMKGNAERGARNAELKE